MYLKILIVSICISNTFGLLLPCANVTKYLCTVDNYYAEWKPPFSFTKLISKVDTEFDLNHILNVNEEKHTITIFLRLKLRWTDPRVQWKKRPWENMLYHSLHLPVNYNEVWVPEVHFSNAMELEKVDAFRDSKLSSFIFFDPYIFEYSESLRIKILCPMTFTDFPFDRQICICRMRNWIDNDNEVFMNPPTVIDTKNVKLGLNGTPTLEEWSNLPFGVLIKPLRSTLEFEDGYNFSTAQVQIQLIRTTDGLFGLIGGYYGPTAIFAVLSLGSFFIRPEIVSFSLCMEYLAEFIMYSRFLDAWEC